MGLVQDATLPAGGTFTLANLVRISQVNAVSKTILLYELSATPIALTQDEIVSATGNGRIAVPVTTVNFPNCGNAATTARTTPYAALWPNFTYSDGEERHLTGANYLAMDGHVKWLKTEQVSYGYRALTNSKSQECFSGGNGGHYAQGSEYEGADARQLTFSYR